ncbi:hypothetical protein J2744_001879 [Halorubrum trapanicum]|uniref:Uncharacterized protein n=1 Tax=Halorubrum trapanicum TaxID=29284 RepID=A0A8J7ULG5_9EURY|nr:hypothetical protein [Halorubrum trapanicum]MBP1902195.1 hypothetical protein [Halorubrum trapanicum]
MTRNRDGADRDDDRPDRPVRRASRRGVLAGGATGLLAGCLVTSEEEDGAAARQTEDGTGGDDSGAGGDDSGVGGDDSGVGGDDSDAGGDGSGGDGGGSGGEAGGDAEEPTPDEVGPDGSGLVVTDATVLDVTESGGRTTVDARLTVENAGRFEYGTVEFRVDAYPTPAGSEKRDSVGFGKVTRRFPSDDRFDGSRTRQFTLEITFPSRRSNVRPDPDRYAVDAAVRRAEPV